MVWAVSLAGAARPGGRLIVLGALLELLYLGGWVLPYTLVGWLPRPAQDLGTMYGASVESAVAYLATSGAALVLSWLAYREAVRHPTRLTARIAFTFTGVFTATLVWVYPFDALDVFDYAMQGRILAVLGGNPYRDLPLVYASDPFLPSVGWKQFPSVYGALWTGIEGAIGKVAGDNLLTSLLLFKAVAALSVLASAYLAYRVALAWQPRRAAGAILLIGWNPLVLLMAGSGHNDILMMALVLGGIRLTASGKRFLGLTVAGLSTLIKLATAPIMPVLAVGQLSEPGCPRRERLRAVAAAGAAVALLSVAMYAPLWPGWARFGPLMRQDLFTPSPLGLLRQLWSPRLGEERATDLAAQLGTWLILAIALLAALRARRGEQASVRAAHDALFWMVFLALTWWQPWYLVWIACLAAIDDRPWVPARTWVVAFAGLVSLFDRLYLTQRWLPIPPLAHTLHTLALVYAPPLLFTLLAPWAWQRWAPKRHASRPCARPHGEVP